MNNKPFFGNLTSGITHDFDPVKDKMISKSTKNVTLAVDFDGTIVEDKFPYVGHELENSISTLKTLKSYGVKLILWTCRSGNYLNDAINFCKSRGLEFDAVNDNIPNPKFPQNVDRSPKVFADFYIDDRAFPPFCGWTQFLEIFKDVYGLA